MTVSLVRFTLAPEDVAAIAAALCTNSSAPTRALLHALKSGHDSVLEHCVFTFRIEGVSRVLLAQLTRHRVASYSIQSQRYCGADLDTVTPDSMCIPELVDDIIDLKKAVEALYEKAIGLGVPEEDARYYTLQAGKTRGMVTMNARELRHFFELRCCSRAQWEIRKLADEMLRLCRDVAPTLFDDAGPGCVRGSCPESRPCGHPRTV